MVKMSDDYRMQDTGNHGIYSWLQGALMIILSIVDFIKKCCWISKGEEHEEVGESSRTCTTRESDRTCNCSHFFIFNFVHVETRPWNIVELGCGFQPPVGRFQAPRYGGLVLAARYLLLGQWLFLLRSLAQGRAMAQAGGRMWGTGR